MTDQLPPNVRGAIELNARPTVADIDDEVPTVEGQFARTEVGLDRPHGEYPDTLMSRKIGIDPARILGVEYSTGRNGQFVWTQWLAVDDHPDGQHLITGRFWRAGLAIERQEGVILSNPNSVQAAINRARTIGSKFVASTDYGFRPWTEALYATTNWSIDTATVELIWFAADDLDDLETWVARAFERNRP